MKYYEMYPVTRATLPHKPSVCTRSSTYDSDGSKESNSDTQVSTQPAISYGLEHSTSHSLDEALLSKCEPDESPLSTCAPLDTELSATDHGALITDDTATLRNGTEHNSVTEDTAPVDMTESLHWNPRPFCTRHPPTRFNPVERILPTKKSKKQ